MTRGLTAGVDTDDIDELINELNKSINGVYESIEAINNIVVKQPIIHTAESFYEISENKKIDAANLSQNIDFNINSGPNHKSHVESKSRSELNLDKIDKPSFDEVADNAINQPIGLIKNKKSLQSNHKKMFLTSKTEEPSTTLIDLTKPGMNNKQSIFKKGITLRMGD